MYVSYVYRSVHLSFFGFLLFKNVPFNLPICLNVGKFLQQYFNSVYLYISLSTVLYLTMYCIVKKRLEEECISGQTQNKKYRYRGLPRRWDPINNCALVTFFHNYGGILSIIAPSHVTATVLFLLIFSYLAFQLSVYVYIYPTFFSLHICISNFSIQITRWFL